MKSLLRFAAPCLILFPAATALAQSPSYPDDPFKGALYETAFELGRIQSQTDDGKSDGYRVRLKTISYSWDLDERDSSTNLESMWMHFGDIDITFDVESDRPDATVNLQELDASIARFTSRFASKHAGINIDVIGGRLYAEKNNAGLRYAETDIIAAKFNPEFRIKDGLLVLKGMMQIDLGFFGMDKTDTTQIGADVFAAAHPKCTTCTLQFDPLPRHEFSGNGLGYHVKLGATIQLGKALSVDYDREAFVFNTPDIHRDANHSFTASGRLHRNRARAEFDLSTIIPPLSKNTLAIVAEYEGFGESLDYEVRPVEGGVSPVDAKSHGGWGERFYDKRGPKDQRLFIGGKFTFTRKKNR